MFDKPLKAMLIELPKPKRPQEANRLLQVPLGTRTPNREVLRVQGEGELETTLWFYVIDSKATYNVLLDRPWIHNNNIVPSTLHQYLKYYNNGSERRNKADENPSTIEKSHFADVIYY
ncbi:hypothetical protein LIER_29772 [Lithospermum erythrorhizon]|uniref:DUF4283 domain-containing protein n=1 Tax=Lithospermum erythrorhizon TaxID=34254 RepID=A0AAV3RN72_LITER